MAAAAAAQAAAHIQDDLTDGVFELQKRGRKVKVSDMSHALEPVRHFSALWQ